MALQRIQSNTERVAGIHYEFDPTEEPLGRGGMGTVYSGLLVDDRFGTVREVAVKCLREDLTPAAIERSRREASIQIRHDNLVEMLGFIAVEESHSVGSLGSGNVHYYVVSELLQGVMLDDLLKGHVNDRNGEIVPYAQKLYIDYQRDRYRFAIQVIRNVLSGLMALHDAGYIHRDIDPTNIMVTTSGHIKLIDFGIAKQIGHLSTTDKALTANGTFIGKPEYAAPELVLGDIREQSKATDLYAVGMLLFQCIVGHTPFAGERVEVLNHQLHSRVPLHLVRNNKIRAIVRKATDKKSRNRYLSAAEFRVALDKLPLNLHDDLIVWRPAYSIAVAFFCICLCAVSLAFYLRNLKTPKENTYTVSHQSTQSIEPASEMDSQTTPDNTPTSPDYRIMYRNAVAIYESKSGDRQQNLREAQRQFQKTRELAIEANDRAYIDSCDIKLSRINKRLNRQK